MPRELDSDGLPSQPADPWVFQPRVSPASLTAEPASRTTRTAESDTTGARAAIREDEAAAASDLKRLRSNVRRADLRFREEGSRSASRDVTPTSETVQVPPAEPAFRTVGEVIHEAPWDAALRSIDEFESPEQPHEATAVIRMVPVLRQRGALREKHHAYVLLRVLTGLNFFGHGYARIFTGSFLKGFAEHMQQQMAHAPLDPRMVLGIGYAIPCVELLVGVLLITGLGVRWALYLALLLMMALMFGVTMAQNWTVAGDQLVYGIVLSLLLFARVPYDQSWPRLIRRR